MKLSKLALGLILALSVQAQAEKVDVNFRDLTISDFIKMVGKITGKNILVDGDIKGKINFVSNTPIDKSELIPLANAILGTKKMTLVKKGNYYQVVKSTTAPGQGLDVSSSVTSGDGTMKTVVFQLSNVNSAVIRTKIKPLLSKSAKVVSFKKNNLLAITDYPRNLKTAKKLIDKIENKQAKLSKVVYLQNARVKDVYPNIQSMSKALFSQDIPSEKVAVMQNSNGNSIILVGKRSNVKRLEKYIQQLDLPGGGDSQRMHVIPLMNSNVEEMEKILSKIVPQLTGRGSISSGGTPARAMGGAPAGAGGMAPSSIGNGKPAPKAVIASDVERNSLIVLANEDQYQNILETVKLLDVEKSQVFIQAKIVEVNTNLAENIGIKYGFNGGAITSNGLFSLAGNAGAPALAISSSLMGFLNQGGTETVYNDAGNVVGTKTPSRFSFDSGISKVFSLGAKLDLLKQNGAAQILSKPSVLSTNNKEASIYVGRTQSILTQSQQSTQGSSNVLNNYSREDIGITLKVKPRLSSNNKVSLEIETTIEDIVPGSGATADRPTTTKRSVKTNAIVNHAETIILGGLIKSADGKSQTKIPILGDIPIIGRLFTSNGNSSSKVNVVIYITPYILKKSADLTSLRAHLDELEAVQQQYNKIVFDRLEARAGNPSNGRHSTFNGQSSYDNDFENPVKALPKPVDVSNGNDDYQVYEPTLPVVSDYTQESDYVQSESIMDTIDNSANSY